MTSSAASSRASKFPDRPMVFTARFLIIALAVSIGFVLLGAPWFFLATADAALIAVAVFDALILDPRQVIRADRRIGPRLSLKSRAEASIVVENRRNRRVTLSLRELIPADLGSGIFKQTIRLAPGSIRVVNYSLMPLRRGTHKLGPLSIRVVGPLGLATRQFDAVEAESVRVYPNISDIRADNLALRRRLAVELGLRNSPWRGLGTEFDSLREYLPDDEWRRINWKVTSRRGKPITNVYNDERTQNIILAIDASRLMVGDRDKLDSVVKSAVVLTHVALNKDDRVGLTVFSDSVHHFILPRKGAGQLALIIDAVFDVDGRLTEPNYWEGLAPAMAYKRRSLVVIFTDVMDEISETLKATIMELGRRHLVLTLFVGDVATTGWAAAAPRGSEGVFRNAAALQLLNDRDRALVQLKQTGAIVRDVLPGQLTPTLVNQYLEIKKRNRL